MLVCVNISFFIFYPFVVEGAMSLEGNVLALAFRRGAARRDVEPTMREEMCLNSDAVSGRVLILLVFLSVLSMFALLLFEWIYL